MGQEGLGMQAFEGFACVGADAFVRASQAKVKLRLKIVWRSRPRLCVFVV
jgi:hypothetical protein